jgi:hypothetical protein
MMNTSQEPTPQWRRSLGLTPGNPFAPYIIGLSLLTIIALIILLILTFVLPSTSNRFLAGTIFMFVGGLMPIPLTLLIIFARNYVRIQDVMTGKYWAHWQYPAGSEHPDVYISSEGIYYPDQPLKLSLFWSGLVKAEVIPGTPAVLRLQYLYRRYYSVYMPPMSSDKTLTVPIPAGKEDEAKALIQQFNKLIGQPSNFINDQWRIGWIMGAVIIGFVLISILLLVPLQFKYQDEKYAAQDATSTMLQATEIVQVGTLLKPIRAVMDKQIEHLESLPDGNMSAQEAGFDTSAGVNTVYYGHCPPDHAFYLYVVMNKEALGRTYFGGPGAFNYTTAKDRLLTDCGPDHLISTVPDILDDGWYYAVIAYISSTRTPRIIDIPAPAATASPQK